MPPENASFERRLRSNEEIELFIRGVLQIENKGKRSITKIRESIYSAESSVRDAHGDTTNNSKTFRDEPYRGDDAREVLREQIVDELIKYDRLDDDDKIRLKKGGAKPATTPKKEKKAFYVIGLPASGKSWVSNKIADWEGAYVVDSDFAKRKFPEYYSRSKDGASIVHEESDNVIFSPMISANKKGLFSYCVEENINVVIPKIGHTLNTIEGFCSTLKKVHDYSVYLVSVDLSREKAVQRAYARFHKTGRYVPLALIFDKYANEPTLNYFRIKQSEKLKAECDKIFSGFMQLSSDVPLRALPVILEQENMDEYIDWLRRD